MRITSQQEQFLNAICLSRRKKSALDLPTRPNSWGCCSTSSSLCRAGLTRSSGSWRWEGWRDPRRRRTSSVWGAASVSSRPASLLLLLLSLESYRFTLSSLVTLTLLVLTSKIRLYWQPNWWNENINIFFKNCWYCIYLLSSKPDGIQYNRKLSIMEKSIKDSKSRPKTWLLGTSWHWLNCSKYFLSPENGLLNSDVSRFGLLMFRYNIFL